MSYKNRYDAITTQQFISAFKSAIEDDNIISVEQVCVSVDCGLSTFYERRERLERDTKRLRDFEKRGEKAKYIIPPDKMDFFKKRRDDFYELDFVYDQFLTIKKSKFHSIIPGFYTSTKEERVNEKVLEMQREIVNGRCTRLARIRDVDDELESMQVVQGLVSESSLTLEQAKHASDFLLKKAQIRDFTRTKKLLDNLAVLLVEKGVMTNDEAEKIIESQASVDSTSKK